MNAGQAGLKLFTLILLTLLALGIFADLTVGEVNIPPRCLLGCANGAYRLIILDIRMPEAIASIIVGAVLGLSGASMQHMLRNPLADPYTTGIAGSAVVGALLGYLLVVAGKLTGTWALLSIQALSATLALASSIIVAVAGFGLGPTGIILLGLLVTLLSYIATIFLVMAIESINPLITLQPLYIMYGDLSAVTWSDVLVMSIALTPLIPLAGRLRMLDLVALGDDVASSSGVNPNYVRAIFTALPSIPLASALAYTGVIGFVGIIAPYLVRHAVGRGSATVVLPLSAIAGSVILEYADALSKVLVKGYVMPITAVTGIIGIPLIIYMVAKGGLGVYA